MPDIVFAFAVFFLCLLGGVVHMISPRPAKMLPAGQ